MVNRKIVGAHYGLMDWLAQRTTAVLMALYLLVMSIALLSGVGSSYQRWHDFMSFGWVRFASFVFIVSLCWHVWVGVRDIWMDYVQSTGLKLTLHVLTLAVLVGYAGLATQIIWRL